MNKLINIELFIGCAPSLEARLCEGLLEFGKTHPQWRFSLRGANFRYTKQWLEEQEVNGVLVLIDPVPVAEPLEQAGIPWVHLLPAANIDSHSVGVDDYAIGKMGAEFFIGKGLFRCAFCGVGTSWSNRRYEGFRSRLERERRECQFIDVPFGDNYDWGLASGSGQILDRWVAKLETGTAVMAAHDILANQLADKCLQRGLRVPRDIMVLGVGNHDIPCKLSPVQISSIDANLVQVAIVGAAMLEGLLEKRRDIPLSVNIQPKGVSERRSTELLDFGDDLVTRAVSFIRDHACGKLSIGDLCKVFPVSRRTLHRRFTKYVGHSPAVELQRARLDIARRMLAETNMSLAEVAFTCGYTDPSHMSRSFRNALSCPPSSIRNRRATPN